VRVFRGQLSNRHQSFVYGISQRQRLPTRGDERLYAEAKGVTKDNGASADILWGQLLRRMTELGTPDIRYALVVPESIKSHVLRVPVVVRQRLGVELFHVTEDGRVRSTND
jgi:hypothetical protein